MITEQMIQAEPLENILWVLLREYTRLRRQAAELRAHESEALYDQYRDILIEDIRELG